MFQKISFIKFTEHKINIENKKLPYFIIILTTMNMQSGIVKML